MNILTIDHKNGNFTNYQLIDGGKDKPIAYREKTPKEVISVLERCRKNRTRIKVNLGDILTGKSWNEENMTFGYIGLSRGKDAYFPILVNNSRSMGGSLLMDDNILQIKESKGKTIFYQSPIFKPSKIEIKEGSDLPEYTHEIYIDGELYSRHKSHRSAKMLFNKLS